MHNAYKHSEKAVKCGFCNFISPNEYSYKKHYDAEHSSIKLHEFQINYEHQKAKWQMEKNRLIQQKDEALYELQILKSKYEKLGVENEKLKL